MRQIVLSTEVTGLSWEEGNRLVEIAGIELVDGQPTGRTYQQHINPQRASEEGAFAVHGLTEAFLAGYPVFQDIVEDFLLFIDHAELLIHNAPFDISFINHELKLAGYGDNAVEKRCTIVDTLVMAKEKFPGQRNSLYALCNRFGVKVEESSYKSALLGVVALAEVYRLMRK